MILIAFSLFFPFFINPLLSYGTDTLGVNQSLSGYQTLVSLSGNYKLGFFQPGTSSNYYVGIWYNKTMYDPFFSQTVVWIANRDTPVYDPFSSKLLIIDGNLVLLDESNKQSWSTNMNSTSASHALVVLLDDGNLVLRYGSNSSPPIWQSFDHPTHAFLPGMKLGYNKLTDSKQTLTSWRNSEDPGMGLFSIEMDQIYKQCVLKWNTTVTYWSTGSWDKRDELLSPFSRVKYVYNFSYVDNENESYFTYSLCNPLITSRLFIDVSGQLRQLSRLGSTQLWNLFGAQPRKFCDVYGVCGSFGVCNEQTLPFCTCLIGFEPRSEKEWNQSDFSSGCVRKTDLICGTSMNKLDFLTVKVTITQANSYLPVKSPEECRTTCLNNCSCHAYSFVGNDCSVWDEELLNLSSEESTNKKTIYVKVSSKDIPHHKENNHFITVIITVSVTGAAVLVLISLVAIIYTRSKRLTIGKTTMEGSLVAFVYKDLQTATKNFSHKLGGGGFGSVFKGVLHDSTIVAVKKLESVNQGDKQFRSEVNTIGIIQHVNLIRLRGFCAQGDNKLLVYDYMSNGSLHSHLFHGKQDGVLNWETRYRIALGTARGLVYLHEKCRDCILHCDIKPENILLGPDFCPKVADFGLAKLVGRDFSRVLTTIRGTRGYLAPEWLSGEAVTAKADVYSYGMMLFELISGKRNIEQSEDSSFTFFPSFAANVVMADGDILSLLDTRLNREANIEQVVTICKVAYWCIQDDVDSRPSMSQVEQTLEGVLNVKMPPIPQSVQFFMYDIEHLGFTDPVSTEIS